MCRRTIRSKSFAQAIRAIAEPIHNRTAEDISMAKLLTLLFEVTALFDMRTRPELLLLQKTMVVVEGVGRSLDPRLDMWTTAEPVVREWISRNLGPAGRLEGAARGAGEIGLFLTRVPDLLRQTSHIAAQIDAATREGIVLAPETVAALATAERRGSRAGAMALWVIARYWRGRSFGDDGSGDGQAKLRRTTSSNKANPCLSAELTTGLVNSGRIGHIAHMTNQTMLKPRTFQELVEEAREIGVSRDEVRQIRAVIKSHRFPPDVQAVELKFGRDWTEVRPHGLNSLSRMTSIRLRTRSRD